MPQLPHRVRNNLRYYVYLYVDPRDHQPFYIGKGKGNRVYAHLSDASETEKVERISELQKLGLEPVIEILKYDLTEREAFLIESAGIDLIGIDRLTNRVKGHAMTNNRALLSDIIHELDAEDVEIEHSVVLINISRMYHYGMTNLELYDATRGVWKVGNRRKNADYAFSVFGGIVRAVYTIAAWIPAGETMTSRDYAEKDYNLSERFEFVGKLAPEKIQRKYVGKSIREYFAPGAQNPIKYVNC
jgi:hypothetical protein